MKDLHKIGNGAHFELDPKKIKVLVWNLYKGKKKNWHEDFSSLAKESDLLILQEAFLNTKMENTFKDQEKFWAFATSFTYKKCKTRTGIITGSIAVPSHIEYKRSEDREMVIKTPKMSLFTYHDLSQTEKRLLVVNIHAINFKGRQSFQRHINQVDEVISEHKGPVIAAGDFNTWSKFRMDHLHDIMDKRNLEPVSFDEDHRTRFFGKPLDHAFIRGGSVVETHVHHGIKSSDHKAFQFEFTVHDVDG